MRACWRDALALWEVKTVLSPPEPLRGGADAWGGRDPLAYIDLASRQVVVNFRLLERIGARDSLTAVLAHEIGHHVRFPHTLGLAAELEVMERDLIPLLAASLTNLFFDLQVNEVVGQTRAGELAAVYRGFVARDAGAVTPLFHFYLAIYEALWGLPAGDLAPAAGAAAMERDYPGWRGDARMFVQTFYTLDDVHLQFIYFCSRFIRYIPDPEKLSTSFALSADVPQDPDAVPDDAPVGSDAMERALEEARRRGWLTSQQAARALRDDTSQVKRATLHRPGSAAIPFKLAQSAETYRRLVDKYLIEPPPSPAQPDPYLPSVEDAWDPGDGPRAIDWPATVLRHGPLAAVAPLKRELLPDDPIERRRGLPAMEIYLDTSGSMPSPVANVNAMTLAAQILSASVLRKGGTVRGVVYSADWILSDWMYHEEVARLFFLNYSGGGTIFPFPVLRTSCRERRDVVRVVVSDADFLWNLGMDGGGELERIARERRHGKGPRRASTLEFALDRSLLVVALLGLPTDQGFSKQALGPVLGHPRFRLVRVADYTALALAARDLARAILD